MAGYRTWCQQCWDKHVEPLLFPPCKGANLEKDSNGVWKWVEVAQFAEDELTQYYDEDQEIPA
jgi:hypothetical protein